MSTFDHRRADARRNALRLLDAAADSLAEDPGASLERVAARAGVSRATLYHHFPTREALLDALTERSVSEVRSALLAAEPDSGPAGAAMERTLRATWQVVGRYRGLMIVNPRRLERAELRRRMAPALAPIRSLIERGQRSGEFDSELGAGWLLGCLTDLVHAAGAQVTAGTMDVAEAERVLLRSAAGLLGARHDPPAIPPGHP